MKTILVPVDLSELTALVVDTATDLALASRCGLHLLHVQPVGMDLAAAESGLQYPFEQAPQGDAPEAGLMQAWCERLAARGLAADYRVALGPPVAEIIEEAQRIGADLIVMGSHGHGTLHHLLLGSVSGGVLRRAKCPVLLVPASMQARQAVVSSTAAARA